MRDPDEKIIGTDDIVVTIAVSLRFVVHVGTSDGPITPRILAEHIQEQLDDHPALGHLSPIIDHMADIEVIEIRRE